MSEDRLAPKRCALCDCLVEVEPLSIAGVTIVADQRVPEGQAIMAPTMCWTCRGGVIAGLS